MRLLVVLLCVACGSGGAGTDAGDAGHMDEHGQDGTRLKVLWFHDGDTWLPSSALFFDTARQENCAPRVWADGLTRCTPQGSDVVYSDAACTQRLGRRSGQGDNPTAGTKYFVATAWVDGAMRVDAVYGGASTGGTQALTTYDLSPDGVCHPLGSGPYSYNPPGARSMNFAVLHDDSVGGPLAPVRWSSDDGMRVEVGVRDRDLDTRCDPVPAANEQATCRPLRLESTDKFADASCTQAMQFSSSPRAAFWPIFTRSYGVDGSTHYWTMSYAVPQPTQAYRLQNPNCVPTTLLSTDFAYAAQREITLSQMSRTVESVPGRRYQRIILSTPEFTTLSDTLFDTQLGSECRVVAQYQCEPIYR